MQATCRISRKTTLDEDLLIRVPHPQAVSLADTIVKAGIHQYPESEFLLIVQTGLRAYLKNEKPVSTSALQFLNVPCLFCKLSDICLCCHSTASITMHPASTELHVSCV